MSKYNPQKVRDKENRIIAEIKADLVEQAETQREMKQHFMAEQEAQVQRQIANEKYQQDLVDQVTAREEAKEFAYQQYLKGRFQICANQCFFP